MSEDKLCGCGWPLTEELKQACVPLNSNQKVVASPLTLDSNDHPPSSPSTLTLALSLTPDPNPNPNPNPWPSPSPDRSHTFSERSGQTWFVLLVFVRNDDIHFFTQHVEFLYLLYITLPVYYIVYYNLPKIV